MMKMKVENGTVYCAGGNNGGTGNYKTNYCAGERKLYATPRLYLRPTNIYYVYLSAGYYEAYVDAYDSKDNLQMSNVVSFNVTENYEKLNGDLNQDGNITLTDLIPLQKHLLLRTNLTTEQSALADLNSDGMINVIDLMLLKRTLLTP